MEWLGAALELPLLLPRPSHWPKDDSRDTFVFDCETLSTFTSRSVPEPFRIWHPLGELRLALRAAPGERPAEGRAASTRLTPWLKNLPAVA
jgi:hypothetical protein